MHIVWDEPKRLTNLEKHELDFRDLTESWFEQAAVKAARGGRHKAIGSLDGHIVAVIFHELGTEAVSPISMRLARRDERRLVE